ncbi:CDP-glycerol glycerophosphotransferase family protein [Bacillus stercoris]|nr:CDP-glycerol glycerophosphotransferase family protein [Bacillus stercoris]
MKKLKEHLSKEYVVILRMHYLVADVIDLEGLEEFAYDMSMYKDIRELYFVSDILITDYSSVFFDFGSLKKPIIFFVPDIDIYRDKLRGFYYDFESEAPGPLLMTTEEVIESIYEVESFDYSTNYNYQKFHSKFCYLESGESTKEL